VDAVLYRGKLPLKRMMALEVGDTLPLDLGPDALVTCVAATWRSPKAAWPVGDRVAVRVVKPLYKPKTTFAMFENAGERSGR